jgi:hypothetical protein
MLYTPHVQAFLLVLNSVDKRPLRSLQDFVSVHTELEVAQQAFNMGVSELWYQLKPKKQIAILELILRELDSIREFDLSNPYDIEDNAAFSHLNSLMNKFHDMRIQYLCRAVTDEYVNNPVEEVPIEDVRSLLSFIRFDSHKEVYESAFYKYQELVGNVIAAKWIFDTDQREQAIEYWKENPDLAGSESIISPSPKLLPPLQWKGSGVELAALFVELEAKGYISLPNPVNYETSNWEKVCRGITSLFSLTSRRPNSVGEPWATLATYFKSKEYNRSTGEILYSKIEGARKKFSSIAPRNTTVDDS